jgi:hypothetical protein
MPADEADEYISKIHHEENVPICHAVIGRITREDLTDDGKQVLDEFSRWSEDRTRRMRNEEWNARRQSKETRTSLAIQKMYSRGLISDQMMMLYGISGALPDRGTYNSMTQEEKERLWSDRMEARFGPNWLEQFRDRNVALPIPRRASVEQPIVNWRVEGF